MSYPTIYDSTDVKLLKTISIDDLKKELRFRHLPDWGDQEELVDYLLFDNERVASDNLQESIILTRHKQNEDSKKLIELQQKVDKYEKLGSNDNNQVSVELHRQLFQRKNIISDGLLSVKNNYSEVQVVSTYNTADAISFYEGNKYENISDWISKVDAISCSLNWSPSLTLVCAVSRLKGAALNWHKVSGCQFTSWPVWKEKIVDRFKCRMSISEFIKYQSKRILRPNESIVEYILAKNAILEIAPFKLDQSDRVSFILEGIIDDVWAIPLRAALCKSVDEIIEHAVPLDTIREERAFPNTLGHNGSSKKTGVSYIKYSKASEAFKAIEGMNGHKLDSSNRRMKVLMATSPGQVRSSSELEYNRLFVFVPKTDTEANLERVFSQYGEVSKVHIVTSRDTGESKGIAFITFTKMSSAALAIENCGPNYKAVFAKPKHEDGQSAYHSSYPRNVESKNPTNSYTPLSTQHRDELGTLTAYVSPNVTYNEFYKIVNIAPELVVVKELPKQFDKKVFQVVYNTIAAAKHAINRINGFEYPPGGYPIHLEFYNPLSLPSSAESIDAKKISKDIDLLSSTVSKALAVIKKAGLSTASLGLSDDLDPPPAPKRGNEKSILPSSDNIFRLFFVCKPVVPPMHLLENTFNFYKGLKTISVIENKNFGYVTYDNIESATRAISTLNDHKISNSRLKVMEAEPREPNCKRMKPDAM